MCCVRVSVAFSESNLHISLVRFIAGLEVRTCGVVECHL